MISSKGLGLLFLIVTSAAWIGASFITQALVSREEQEPAALEPWLLTLICSSTLMLYLPIGHFARKRARYEGRVARAARSPKPRARQRKGSTPDDVALEHATGCLHPRRRAAAAAASAVVDSTAVEVDEESEEDGGEASDAEAGAPGRARVTRSGGDQAAAARAVRGMERQPLLHTHKHPQHGGSSDAASAAAQAGAMPNGDAEGVDGGVGGGDGSGEVETSQIVRAAFVVAPVWFAAQLAFTTSLEYTSVTSNTVLSSCSSLFVYLGSLALGQEIGSALRFASVIAAMAGTMLVALGDKRNESGSSSGGSEGGGGGGSNPLFGDALTLIAAALYALYTIMMKRLLVKDDAIVMALFFGTIGVLYFSVLAPVAGALALAGSSVVRRVTSRALGLALVQGLIDYVAADYAWARAVMLLGPTATSCGLAMQIPAAGIIDALLNGSRLSWSESPGSLAQFVIGSLLIICGFIGVSLEPRVVSALWRRCCERGDGRAGGTVVIAPSSGGGGGGGGSRGGRGGGNADSGESWPAADPSEGGELLRPEGRSAGLRGPAGKAAITISEDGNASGGSAGELHAARVGLLEGEVRRGRRGSGGGGGGGAG
ncbi:hypothetical protein VaNZ11_011238, partial [Volvox africanus]